MGTFSTSSVYWTTFRLSPSVYHIDSQPETDIQRASTKWLTQHKHRNYVRPQSMPVGRMLRISLPVHRINQQISTRPPTISLVVRAGDDFNTNSNLYRYAELSIIDWINAHQWNVIHCPARKRSGVESSKGDMNVIDGDEALDWISIIHGIQPHYQQVRSLLMCTRHSDDTKYKYRIGDKYLLVC